MSVWYGTTYGGQRICAVSPVSLSATCGAGARDGSVVSSTSRRNRPATTETADIAAMYTAMPTYPPVVCSRYVAMSGANAFPAISPTVKPIDMPVNLSRAGKTCEKYAGTTP